MRDRVLKGLYFPKKGLYWILVASAVIVMAQSLESLMLAKDAASYEVWNAANGGGYSIQDYTAVQVFRMIQGVLIPIAYGLYAFFAFQKGNFPVFARRIWGILLMANAVVYLLAFSFGSVFYYIIGAADLFTVAINGSFERL